MKVPQAFGAPRRLLVVDDEEKICNLLAGYFSLKGYDVRVVCRGEDAVAATAAFHPEIVLLDLLMPGMSGVDTLQALKRLNPTPHVLVVSVVDQEDTVQSALSFGADFYVCKPINLVQLEHLVKGLCPPAAASR